MENKKHTVNNINFKKEMTFEIEKKNEELERIKKLKSYAIKNAEKYNLPLINKKGYSNKCSLKEIEKQFEEQKESYKLMEKLE